MEEVKCQVCGYFAYESKAIFDSLENATCLDCERESEEHAYEREEIEN